MVDIFVKSVHAQPEAKDGFRVMVDTQFPPGLNAESTKIDLWLGQIAPTTRLQKWFRDDRDKWDDFLERYHSELDENGAALTTLFNEAAQQPITLVFAGKDVRCNTAVALKRYLDGD
jgi:uncharacterized protein YeaO (DUF488 family)